MIKYIAPFLFVITVNVHGFTLSDNSFGGIARVYGYVLGQEQTLELIEKNFPELQQEVLLNRLKFQSSYPELQEKSEGHIVRLAGDKGLDLMSNVKQQLIKNQQKEISKAQAIEFLKTVSNRADGIIENQITRDFMLAITHFNNPEREISEKKTIKFNTKNEPKAKGLDLTVTLPLSWLEQQGNSPNSIRTWKSEAGSGVSIITFLVYNSNDARTKEQVKAAINRKDLRNMVHPRAEINRIIYSEVSNQAGWYVESEIIQQRLDLELYMVNKNLYALYQGKTIEIGCGSGGLSLKKDEVIKESKRVESLCRAVLSSLIINNVYQ